MSKILKVLFLLMFVVVAGCSQSGAPVAEKETQIPQANNSFNPFPIYTNIGSRDNHFVPSGFMPDGACIEFSDRWIENCHSEKTCIRADYDVECSRQGERWVGVYWQNPANNWGNRKGGFDLSGATKLTFWAKGENGGERIEEFKMGGITGDYPDTDTAFIGPVVLTPEWKQYTIDLRGKDLSYVSGGFSWSTNVDVNPENCTFYLDDIRYE
ncbi:MAG: hypothetical protein PHY73_01005 [Candidatus Omnitrophica bacterium]|nr:hypothetical protein [Candidatus Omnitrophota bacterium]